MASAEIKIQQADDPDLAADNNNQTMMIYYFSEN